MMEASSSSSSSDITDLTVASVPTGTGVMVMANRNVHVFDNDISGNQSAGVLLVSYAQAYDDPAYNPLPRDIVVRDNRIGRTPGVAVREGRILGVALDEASAEDSGRILDAIEDGDLVAL